MVFPVIQFLKPRGGRKLSDIEFLAIKEFEGKRVDAYNEVVKTTATEADLVTATAGTGKDMYLASAKASMTMGATGFQTLPTFRLYINGSVVEKFQVRDLDSSVHPETSEKYTFLTKGVKVDAGQIIKITVEQDTTNSTTYHGKLILWEESDGESPQVSAV